MKTDRLSDSQVIKFYQELAYDCVDQIPMLRLVECLTQKEYASLMQAFTSHNTLVFGRSDLAPDDAVSVTYLSHLKLFEIRYSNHKGKVERHRCEMAAAERLIDSLAMRLFITTERSDDKP